MQDLMNFHFSYDLSNRAGESLALFLISFVSHGMHNSRNMNHKISLPSVFARDCDYVVKAYFSKKPDKKSSIYLAGKLKLEFYYIHKIQIQFSHQAD